MTDSIRAVVQAQVEEKIAAGETLQAAIDAEDRARESYEESQRSTQSARRDALKAGWTENELKRLGLAGGAKRTRARAKREDAPSGVDHEQ